MEVIIGVVITLIVAAGAYFAGNKLNKKDSGSIVKQAEELASKMLDDARREADTITKEAELKAKDAGIRGQGRARAEDDAKRTRIFRLLKNDCSRRKKISIKKLALIDQKEMDILKKEQAVSQKEQALDPAG